jgi:hypothetical protein
LAWFAIVCISFSLSEYLYLCRRSHIFYLCHILLWGSSFSNHTWCLVGRGHSMRKINIY